MCVSPPSANELIKSGDLDKLEARHACGSGTAQ